MIRARLMRESSGTLSTVSAEERQDEEAREKKYTAFVLLDARRRSARISIEALVSAAGVSERTYRYAQRRIKVPRVSTMRALKAALDEIRRGAPRQDHLAALWRSTLSFVSIDMGLVPADVLSADPHANLKGDERWNAAAQARHRALYLLVIAHNVPMSQIAVVAGISKQAVSKALRKVEDGRDDPVRNRVLERAADCLSVPL